VIIWYWLLSRGDRISLLRSIGIKNINIKLLTSALMKMTMIAFKLKKIQNA